MADADGAANGDASTEKKKKDKKEKKEKVSPAVGPLRGGVFCHMLGTRVRGLCKDCSQRCSAL